MLPARIPTRIKVERILCPTDYSDFSKRALAQAVRLASWFEASVTVVHVLPPPTWMVTPDVIASLDVQADILSAERHEQEQALERFVAPYRGKGVAIHSRLLDGDPSRLIQEAVVELPADLVVMGTHGRSGFERVLLGSVTEKVLYRATCPVLTVGWAATSEPDGPLFRRILCAMDLSTTSSGTLDLALSLAEENMARVTLLHVVEGAPGQFGPERYRSLPEVARIRKELFEEAQLRLHRSVPAEALAYCSVSERVEEGAPWQEILRVADARDADVIVMGAHQDGGLNRAVFGSTVSQVVREAHCPVLVVREGSAHRTVEEVAATSVASAPQAAAGR